MYLAFLVVKLKSSLRNDYGLPDFVKQYILYVSEMITDMFFFSEALPGSFLIHGISPGL